MDKLFAFRWNITVRMLPIDGSNRSNRIHYRDIFHRYRDADTNVDGCSPINRGRWMQPRGWNLTYGAGWIYTTTCNKSLQSEPIPVLFIYDFDRLLLTFPFSFIRGWWNCGEFSKPFSNDSSTRHLASLSTFKFNATPQSFTRQLHSNLFRIQSPGTVWNAQFLLTRSADSIPFLKKTEPDGISLEPTPSVRHQSNTSQTPVKPVAGPEGGFQSFQSN